MPRLILTDPHHVPHLVVTGLHHELCLTVADRYHVTQTITADPYRLPRLVITDRTMCLTWLSETCTMCPPPPVVTETVGCIVPHLVVTDPVEHHMPQLLHLFQSGVEVAVEYQNLHYSEFFSRYFR